MTILERLKDAEVEIKQLRQELAEQRQENAKLREALDAAYDQKGGGSVKQIILECDELDYAAIQHAFARHQSQHSMPDGDGNLAGRLVAEICRGWEELVDWRPDQKEDASE